MSVALAAVAAPGKNVSQFCKENGDLGLSHGECVSVLAKNPATFCKEEVDGQKRWEIWEFDNQGQCVKDFWKSPLP